MGYISKTLITITLLTQSLVFAGTTQKGPKSFSIMSYNALNLFDAKKDEGKSDWTYLPMATKLEDPRVFEYCETQRGYYKDVCYSKDWTNELIRKKSLELARVIKEDYSGIGPDFVVFQEVENINALNMLNTMGNLNYPYVVLIEGPDKRGIDCGILSRYPLDREPVLHPVDFTEERNRGLNIKDTRSILEAVFRVNGKKLAIMVNHWPSQGNIDEARLKTAKTMYEASKNITDAAVISLGDFNTLPDDLPHGIQTYITNPDLEHSFIDARMMKADRFKGTHWYRGHWSELDRIFFKRKNVSQLKNPCKNRQTCLEPLWDTYKVHNYPWVLHDTEYYNQQTGQIEINKGIPKRFDDETGEGFSDHMAISIKFNL